MSDQLIFETEHHKVFVSKKTGNIYYEKKSNLANPAHLTMALAKELKAVQEQTNKYKTALEEIVHSNINDFPEKGDNPYITMINELKKTAKQALS